MEEVRSGSGQAQIMKGSVGHEIKFGFYSGRRGKTLEVSCLFVLSVERNDHISFLKCSLASL